MNSSFFSRLSLRRYNVQLWLFVAPFLLGALVLTILPALATVAVAFTNYNAVSAPTWAGMDNFTRLLSSAYVRISLRNTIYFLVLAVPLRLLGALLLALLLQSERRGFGLHRAAVYLPTVIPEVAYALIWLWILNPVYGPLNMLLGNLGIQGPAWLTEPGTARFSIVLLSLFTIGEGFVILLTGLRTIPRSYFEAARVDGASAWQAFWHLTLPLILPWLLLLTFRDLVISLQNTFTPSFVLTYGGPYYATTFVPLLLYELAFDFFDFGMAAALLLFTYLVIGLIIMGILNLVGSERGADDF
ncbi:MAG TPA: sugar ABC transporter permease [Chloroflexota bacterium]|nr:sugar ABC transporter permease [Chloroflexota bacterium]HUM68623.1 sugar ABC transporter permease [Chloroflexota bacterium]